MKTLPKALMISAAIGLPAAEASASETGNAPPSAMVSLARHHTTNALDGPLALRDWYSLLRGTIEDSLAHDLGTTRFAAEVSVRRFDTHHIEDDFALAAAMETTGSPFEALELRGTLSMNLSDEGDDLVIGDTIIGTRLGIAVLTAAAQAGLRLAPGSALVLEASAAREIAGNTRFQGVPIAPLKLEPDRTRFALASTFTQSLDPFTFGANAAATWQRADPAGVYREIVLGLYTARLTGAVTSGKDGFTLGAAGGVQLLRLINGDFRDMRPTYELAASAPLFGALSLGAALTGAYDITARDDPVASWVRRRQVEAAFQTSATVRLTGGAFIEERENLALGTGRVTRGVFGQVAWQAAQRFELSLKVDATRNTQTAPNARWRAIETQFAIATKL